MKLVHHLRSSLISTISIIFNIVDLKMTFTFSQLDYQICLRILNTEYNIRLNFKVTATVDI